MFHQKLKQILNDSIATLHSDMDSFVVNPGKDLSRVKKISADSVVSFLISQGASSSKCEIEPCLAIVATAAFQQYGTTSRAYGQSA